MARQVRTRKPGKKSKLYDYSKLRIYVMKVTFFDGDHTYLRTAGWSDKDALNRIQKRVTEEFLPAEVIEIHSTMKLPV